MKAAGVAGALALATAIAFFACDDEHRRTPPGKVFGGGPCEARPGELPDPRCDSAAANGCGALPGCVIDEVRCGSKSTCLPLADNAGKSVVDLRFRRLNIAAPAALAAPLVQDTIVNRSLDLAEPTCAEKGLGTFTWILRLDRGAGTLTTGGAAPSKDPIGTGFCFASFELGTTRIAPLVARVELSGDTFRTTERLAVNIPIFQTDALDSAIVLPISGARIEGATLSADGNCIGSFQEIALDPSCGEDRTLCSKWRTAGSLGGYITLEAADAVKIRDLGDRSLCAFLTGRTDPSGLLCARTDGRIAAEGDYCSTDDAPGGCKDSVWLAATFAASAAKIFDGRATVAGCSGSALAPDAASLDASADADAD